PRGLRPFVAGRIVGGGLGGGTPGTSAGVGLRVSVRRGVRVAVFVAVWRRRRSVGAQRRDAAGEGLHPPADADGRFPVLLLGAQEQQGGAGNLIALLDPHVNAVGAEVPVLDEVGGERAVGAAGRGVFGRAVVVGEDADVQVVLGRVGLGSEGEQSLGL